MPPALFARLAHGLGRVGPGDEATAAGGASWSRSRSASDRDSARDLDRQLREVFGEDQIYRIDHFLGKETVQNMLVFRFANPSFEPVWNRNYIDHVQITVAEDIGIGTRADFYEQTGVVRDMVQNHLLQLLCLAAIEPPVRFDADALRNETAKVLDAIVVDRSWTAAIAVRGQYGPGRSGRRDGRAATARRTACPPDSTTPTFAAMQADDRQLAMGRRAVLPAHRQAAGAQADRGRHPVQADAARRCSGDARAAAPRQRPRVRAAAGRGDRADVAAKQPGPDLEVQHACG